MNGKTNHKLPPIHVMPAEREASKSQGEGSMFHLNWIPLAKA